ncbi:probable LRR receptor-like serine/threonine-protein kinase At3g47570 [Lolium rigidum]|uniref:probable LRR receptor-like serine/threonine-protein kinase At3g47570 n=1 Tax=Lolium rigidum TaxID=89674 RepID=UPI001F5E2031|nr:probable LRR receptor-like serine/threonine-protein kinase At3g47570 [Lolium rigidum]
MATPVVAKVFLLSLLWLAAAEGTDRDVLLAFKAAVTSDPTGALRSWTNDTAGAAASVCRWAGVNCSSAGRVTSLDVSSRGIEGTLSPAVGDLEYLDFLNLTDNALSGSIPASLGKLKRLSFLSLCDNVFSGEIPGALGGAENLTVLYLNGNRLTGGVPAWLGAMPMLVYLTLNQNALTGTIPLELANLTTIQMLRLDENFLEGDIPDVLTRLPRLQMLNVYGNRLTGEIPRGFFNMSSLQGFSLAKNAFHGELPRDAGARSPNLMYLYLGGNQLSGPIPASLANATKLQFLSLANNNFSGQVPVEIGRLCLYSLQLSGNELTATDAGGWEFLDNLTNCNALYEIIFGDNNLSGALPSSIARLSPQFRTLSLAGNRISGVIPPGIANVVGLQTLDIQYNLLTGVIPDGIGKLKGLQELQLQGNKLTGPVPYSMGNLTSLLRLDLSGNSLNGSIPPSLGNLQRLTLLNLSRNGFVGHVPIELFSGLSALSSAIDLSGNQLDGVLPREVGQLVKLARMVLSGNRFVGDVPAELGSCQSLEFLELDGNLFTGSIPPSLSRLKGLRSLNLSSNRLTGAIPPEVGQMSGLQELDLSRNDLSGGVPAGLENLTSLIELDVSDNNLDGQVPLHGVFANKTGFNMAGNSALCGGAPQLRLPRCRSLADSGSTRGTNMLLKIALPIIGAALCLAILLTLLWRRRKTKSGTETTAACIRSVVDGNFYPRVSYAELAKATDGFAEANLVGAGKFGSVYRGTLFLNKAKKKPAAAHEAVAVAVKVFDLRQVGASKTFLSECETLRSARHRNLISIITCCSSVDAAGGEFRALVFDFMPNSSLDRWLHPGPADLRKRGGLSLVQRLGIAVDIADGLSYLHDSCDPPIVHCDLKPGNVLLDDDMTARIGDFGLAKLLLLDPAAGAGNTESTIGIRGTIGYVAPEYGTTGSVSAAGDAYSFGITLLEILVGKAPTEGGFGEGRTLPEFVTAAFPERIEQVLDPALLPIEEPDDDSEVRVTARDCLVSAVRVGLNCCRRAPYERMSMKEAAAEMHLIRDAYLRACGAKPSMLET